jgi:hypothetical protein
MASRAHEFDARLIETVDRAVQRAAHCDPLLFSELVTLRRHLVERAHRQDVPPQRAAARVVPLRTD